MLSRNNPGADRAVTGSEAAARRKVDRLTEDLARAHEALTQRDAELKVLRADLAIARLLAKNLRKSAVRSARAVEQLRAVSSIAIPALAKLAAIVSWHARRRSRTEQFKTIQASGLFDTPWYLARYPDVAESGWNPLLHYIDFGAAEGRDPHPLFDSDWYLATYPEVALANMNPLVHYLSIGHAHGFDPNPLFHTAWYLEQNPDAAKGKVNALRHYMDHAGEAGRNPNPYFDSAWYLKQNPDVAAAGANPLVHYVRRGAAEKRDPHPSFDTDWYLAEYPRVAKMGISPLQHYLTVGALEGCRPEPTGNRPDGASIRKQQKTVADAGLASEHPQPAQIEPPAQSGTRRPAKTVDLLQWRLKIAAAKPLVRRPPGAIGVFVHLFYEDMADEVALSLRNIPFDFKVHVSTDSDEKKSAIEASFEQAGLAGHTTVKVLPNLGWDIAPFLVGFADEIRRHDICLKIHAKKSKHYAGEFGQRWRAHLFRELIGDRGRVAFAVDNFVAHKDLGILMAQHWKGIARRVNIIGPNYRPMRTLLNRLGISIVRSQFIEFPSGSMFWFRAPALAPLLDMELTWDDFADCYTKDVDATLAHAVERSVLFSAASAGYRWGYLPRQRRWAVPRPGA